MIEDITNIDLIGKKEWQSPVLFQLDFKKTRGGPTPGNTEDSYENNPVTGSQ